MLVLAYGAARVCELRGEELVRRAPLDYNGTLHGDDWPQFYASCAGNQQSPVNLASLSWVMSEGKLVNLESLDRKTDFWSHRPRCARDPGGQPLRSILKLLAQGPGPVRWNHCAGCRA